MKDDDATIARDQARRELPNERSEQFVFLHPLKLDVWSWFCIDERIGLGLAQ